MAKPEPLTRIVDPLVIIFPSDDGTMNYHLHPKPDHTYECFGILICDLIRQTALAFDVPESAVFEWVEKEWRRPTSAQKQWAIKQWGNKPKA